MVTDTNDKVYIEGDHRFATTSGFLGVFKKKSSLVLDSTHFVPQRSPKVLGKKDP